MLSWIGHLATAGAGIASVAVLVTSVALVISRDWRASLAVLSAQYVFTTLLTASVLPVPVALVKLIAGWIACAILLLTSLQIARTARHAPERASAFAGLPFRAISAVMVAVVIGEASGRPGFSLPGLSPQVNSACLVLVGLALLQLGLGEAPMFAGVGLLTLLSGFELFHAAIEPSVAVVGLLAVVNIGVALAISHVAASSVPPTPQEMSP